VDQARALSARTVAFYISGHGFGHASREVEVVNALGARRPDLDLVIRSAVDPALLQRTLRVPCTVRPGPCDTGVIQRSSVAHDDDATVEQAIAFHATLDARAEAEAASWPEPVALVVGDIPALAFETAARLGCPSIAIGNFTWDWIYESMPGFASAPWLVPAIRRAYRRATLALALPFGGGFDVFPQVRAIPLIARRPTRRRDDTRTHFGIDAGRPAALLSFGGYGMPELCLTAVDCLDDWTVVTTDRVTPRAAATPHVRVIEEAQLRGSGFRYEDLVSAVDVVITKPGYGIIAECIAAGTPMLYTSRGTFREYDVLVAECPRYLRCRFIAQADLFGGRWRASLDALLAQPAAPESMPIDGADVAAALLESFLNADAGRR
jgi:hypothetical protein